MKKKLKFEKKVMLITVTINFIALILSYSIFLNDKITSINNEIETTLKNTAFALSQDDLIQEKLKNRENDFTIQKYTKKFIENINDIDIIVIGDMDGIKYSHLDENQIGQEYVNNDNQKVINEGESYFSLMEGSMGKTFRWFEPIFKDEVQVGFIMVGKFNYDINQLIFMVNIKYMLIFIITIAVCIVASKLFARNLKRSILGMEPYEISLLYSQKNAVINSVNEGIIALNDKNEVMEINRSCYNIFDNFDAEIVIDKLATYINDGATLNMKEMIILGKKIFVTLYPMRSGSQYQGVVITLVDKENINKIAKEITGIDEVIKSLRATVHEFKNNMHVILGLLQLGEYDEAKKYIMKCQEVKQSNLEKFNCIKDYYVKALLISRELVANEKNVQLEIDRKSIMFPSHKIINSYDIVTILGNLIENAFEAANYESIETPKVEVSILEDKEKIKLTVTDNGYAIDKNIKEQIFLQGKSSKGKGRGTGLYLVKNRVDLYEGNIIIEERDKKKTFSVVIFKGD
ncbi:MAG: ATP-binding protein [Clostridiaceae bacterium]|nr:ATP-binding protein [Clostridiaceae bacterium]